MKKRTVRGPLREWLLLYKFIFFSQNKERECHANQNAVERLTFL